MKLSIVCSCALITIALMSSLANAAQRNIFDDDWTPPKSNDTPRPTLVKPPAVTPTPTANDPTPAAPTPPAVRLPIPAKSEQAAVRKLLKEVYAEQLTDRSVPARRRLSDALITQADKSTHTPVDQFVLLAAAIDAASEAANLPLAFEAADRMGGAFNVDILALKTETITKLNFKNAPTESAAADVDAGLEFSEQLLAADDYAAAARVCTALQSLTAGDADLRAEVQMRQREVGVSRDAHDKAARDAEKLKVVPDDPAANLAVGRYICFFKGDWPRGLPMLAKGSDITLKTLAELELANPSSPDEIVRLADRWWDASTKQSDTTSRSGVMTHAAALYNQIIDKVEGLRRSQIEKRMKEASIGNGEKRWLVVFRSSDPAIWNTNTDEGPDRFAIELSRCPKDVQFLKLSTGDGKFVIIPMTQPQIGKRSADAKFFWNGSNEKSWGARHLGIVDDENIRTGKGISFVGESGHNYAGWGFGHKANVNDNQYYSWDRNEIPPTIFEISVRSGSLTAKEKTALLK